MFDLTGKDKAEVLRRLYNAADVQGSGFIHARPGDMTLEQARKLLDSSTGYFDYVSGRVMKINLSGDTLDTRLYDRDNGFGAAAQALQGM